MRLSEDIPEYGLTVWCAQSRLPIENNQRYATSHGGGNRFIVGMLLLGAMFFSVRLTQLCETLFSIWARWKTAISWPYSGDFQR
jgi:hypothetical protein